MTKSLRYFGINVMFLLFLLTYIPQWVAAGPLLLSTEGYASGQLSKVSRDTNVTRAYVGEVSLGHESMTFISLGNQPPNLVSNPWEFCFEKDRYEELENLIGNDIVLEFKTPKKNSLLSCSAVNELVNVYPVIQNQPLEQKHLIGSIYTMDREISQGVEFGRITNLIKNKSTNRSYFMTIQVGTGGSKFRHFFIDDHDLYDFAVTVLKSAVLVKVHYSDRLAYFTNFYGFGSRSVVSEIEVVD
ncbi:hypothetical protein [Nitrosomonas supralitoralis]|uniref:Uncharacterized protein n=1 Tax=Nitrosomonas supralitoralis TaxID=2116706 RepID=A0A2P7NXC5_9PROT|nr:hypothetical protein [Nitrosomonas supralitoralis]PSJ18095.1 hypothetical protein C7H79_04365 [Nitrosomonas supralitoralis]